MERLLMHFDDSARAAIKAEVGSVSIFRDRMEKTLKQELQYRVTTSDAHPLVGDDRLGAPRGGELVEITAAVAGLISSASPIIIAWLKSRQFAVEETTKTLGDGVIIHTIRVTNSHQ